MKTFHIVVQQAYEGYSTRYRTLDEGTERASREDVALKRFLWAAWAIRKKVPAMRRGEGLMIGIVRQE